MILFAGFSFLIINKIILQHGNFTPKKVLAEIAKQARKILTAKQT